jgi:phosphoribosylglycinamide formyltransferase-1
MEGRVAVLASGTGTNLQALLDDPVVGPHVALVLSDRPGATALARARDRGVETAVLEPGGFPSRDAHDEAIVETLHRHRIDVVVLAGYMRILGHAVVEAFRDRIVNVHPALLPAFPGARAIDDALAHGVRVTGVTVHLVDEEVDHGPILAQEAVTVVDDDTAATLAARIHEVEHRLLPAATTALLEGRVRVVGRRAIVAGSHAAVGGVA